MSLRPTSDGLGHRQIDLAKKRRRVHGEIVDVVTGVEHQLGRDQVANVHIVAVVGTVQLQDVR